MTEQSCWAGCVVRGFLMFGLTALTGACSFGPRQLEDVRIPYNEAVKSTSEQQLLLNIVRLRYTEAPTSMLVSSIAAQFECTQTGQAIPFFASTSAGLTAAFQTNAAILPGGSVSHADRPTFTFTPIDHTEFTRKLFTPLTLEGVIYLADTSWPASTVLRLFAQYINGVPNGEPGDGPTAKQVPVYSDFLHGMAALEALRDRLDVHFTVQERVEKLGGALPAASIPSRDVVEAAKNGHELRPDEGGKTWTLVKRTKYPIVSVNPLAVGSPEMLEFAHSFHIQPGLREYEISREALPAPFEAAFPETGLKSLELETRSLGQALFFVAKGVEVPPEHIAEGTAPVTLDADGKPFDWQEVLGGLFKVHCAKGRKPPPHAYVSICYRGYWFYVDDRDCNTKASFALLKLLTGMEVSPTKAEVPLLTLPVGR